MPYVITEACIDIKDRACVDVCPVDCIYEGGSAAVHPPRRVHRLRRVRAGVPGNRDLPRGGRAGRTRSSSSRSTGTSSRATIRRESRRSSRRGQSGARAMHGLVCQLRPLARPNQTFCLTANTTTAPRTA